MTSDLAKRSSAPRWERKRGSWTISCKRNGQRRSHHRMYTAIVGNGVILVKRVGIHHDFIGETLTGCKGSRRA